LVVRLKRADEAQSVTDGERYLVERPWPRGISSARLALTDWLKGLAQSTDLRRC